MTTTSTTNTTQTTQTNTAQSSARQKLGGDYTTFLKLLATQLQNQNPLDPVDTAEFTNQLVMYSQVEQQLSTNDKLDGLLSAQTYNTVAGAVNYIGKSVVIQSDKFLGGDGESVELFYALESKADFLKLSVLDAEGKEVWSSQEASNVAGLNKVTWDGKDSAGNKVDAGTYTLKIDALDKEDKTIASEIYVSGKVTGVEQVDGSIMLDIGGNLVTLDKVQRIGGDIVAGTPDNDQTDGDDSADETKTQA